MTHSGKPIVRVLEGNEAQALLARNRVGRIAYSLQDRVEIEPIHYVVDPPWIYGRTNLGARLLSIAPGAWCAFETDEVEGMWDWRSVVVKGPFGSPDAPHESWDHDRAVACLRQLLPTAFTTYDPTPHRDVVFAIRISEISGRSCVSNGVFEGHRIEAQSQPLVV